MKIYLSKRLQMGGFDDAVTSVHQRVGGSKTNYLFSRVRYARVKVREPPFARSPVADLHIRPQRRSDVPVLQIPDSVI